MQDRLADGNPQMVVVNAVTSLVTIRLGFADQMQKMVQHRMEIGVLVVVQDESTLSLPSKQTAAAHSAEIKQRESV